MLRTLIRKDIRLNIVLLRITVTLIFLSYVFAAIMGVTGQLEDTLKANLITRVVWFGSTYSHLLLQFSIALLAANVIAAERTDGSAEFLTYLPFGRRKVLLSKAIVLCATCLAASTIHIAAMFGTAWAANMPSSDLTNIAIMILLVSSAGFCASGIGWFASCSASGNAAAILVVIVGFPVTNMLMYGCIELFDIQSRSNAVFVAGWIGIGLAGFAWGTRHFLNRIGP